MKAAKAVTVQIRAGTYYLAQPLTFSDQDSGKIRGVSCHLHELPERDACDQRRCSLESPHLDKSGRWQTTIPEVSKGECGLSAAVREWTAPVPAATAETWFLSHRGATDQSEPR